MANKIFNHQRRVLDTQLAKIKTLYPGTIVEFKYSGNDIFDKEPMVLILWNDYKNYKIHGINLNYLSEFKIKSLFGKVMTGGVSKKDDVKLTLEDQVSVNDYDDNLPYKNLLKDPYTRLQLPTYKQNRGGNPLSNSEAVTQMNRLYEKVLKKIVTKSDIYRTYNQKKIKSARVITYDIEGLLK